MNVIQIDAGARARARGTQGITPENLNASNAVLNKLRPIRRAAKAAKPGLSRDKVTLVHVAKQQVGLAEDLYRAMLMDVAGVSSSKDLTLDRFLRVMQRFERLGFKRQFSPPARADQAPRIGMATPAQMDYIRGLWAQWSGHADEAAMTAWIENKYHVSALRFLDVVRAQKAIEGLKAMHARKAAKQLAPKAATTEQTT